MRKPAFCKCENKGADQLHGNHAADQCLCFRYMGSTISLLPKSKNFKAPATFCGCTAQFVWVLVGHTEDRFWHDMAQILLYYCLKYTQQKKKGAYLIIFDDN